MSAGVSPQLAEAVTHLRTWRCARCERILFEHARPLAAIAAAAGLLRLKCASCNHVNALPRPG